MPDTRSNSTARFALAAILIACTAILLHARNHEETYPPRMSLQTFPQQLGNWTGTDIPIPQDQLDVLGPGDFLHRIYLNPKAPPYDVDLYIAYFPSQRAGDTIHSPQNCLPGAGWTPVQNTRVLLDMPGHAPFPANRYVIVKGDLRSLVLYWYWAHNRGVASEYWAKYYLVRDSIKMNRSDGSLVRIITPMAPGESAEAAARRLLPFTNSVLPLMNDYIPR
ncbi:MAG TPA: EpsI family protein [Candidatus Sulfotelmatobacter sp.]|nr:EpsI family protein [Candidatus Sulfotelmatobacter sp.]